MVLAAVMGALLVGFLAGLSAFRVKSRWCPECGGMTNVEPRRPATAVPHRHPPGSTNQRRFR